MFTVETIDLALPGMVPDHDVMDTAESFDSALSRYAEIAWEDPPHVLLGRTVIIREAGTGDVWAVGAYGPDARGTPYGDVLTFLFPRHNATQRFLKPA